MGFAVDTPAEPMVAGARQLRRNLQYIGTVSTATYISCTKNHISTLFLRHVPRVFIDYFILYVEIAV